ncbi:hypothetical protein V1477_019923, partial [Vespula maculifrons]
IRAKKILPIRLSADWSTRHATLDRPIVIVLIKFALSDWKIKISLEDLPITSFRLHLSETHHEIFMIILLQRSGLL